MDVQERWQESEAVANNKKAKSGMDTAQSTRRTAPKNPKYKIDRRRKQPGKLTGRARLGTEKQETEKANCPARDARQGVSRLGVASGRG